MATLATIRTAVLDIVNDTASSATYDTTYLDRLINEVELEICSERKWPFLRNKKIYVIGNTTTFSSDVATVDTTLNVGSTTNFEAAGAIWANYDVMSYTGLTSTTLTGVTGISVAQSSGDKVYPLYLVPSDYFNTPVLLRRVSGGDAWREVEYVDERLFDNERLGDAYTCNKYTIVHDESDNTKQYLRLAYMNSGDYIVFNYDKKPTTMSDDADTSTIPDPWATKTISKMVAARAMVFYNDNEEGLGDKIEQQAQKELFKMMKYYDSREQTLAKRIKPTYTVNRARGSSRYSYNHTN